MPVPPSIFVAVPCDLHGGFRPFDQAIVNFLQHHPEAEIDYSTTGVIPAARNRSVRKALLAQDRYVAAGGKAEDHRIWWLDDDQPFDPRPGGDFDKLLAHHLDAVIPLSLRRGAPFLPLLYDGVEDDWVARQHFLTDHERGLIKVAGAGMAGLLIRTDCFRTMGADAWFEFVHPPGNADDYCLAVDERILTADLRWVRSGDLKTGDQILAIDEEPTRTVSPTSKGLKSVRRWTYAEITASRRDAVECRRVTLADGTSIICTPDHPWLVDPLVTGGHADQQWVRTDDLMTGRVGPGRWGPRRGHYVLRALHPWTTDESRLAGWLAGIFDGEGWVLSNYAGTRVAAAQKDGPLQDEIVRAVHASGFKSSTIKMAPATKAVKTISILGGFDEQVRFLGTIRPSRLLADWQTKWQDRQCRVLDRVQVISVESVGVREIQRLSSSAKTYVGEGFLMHNSEDFPFYRKLEQAGIQLHCDLEVRFGHATTIVSWPIRQHGKWMTALAIEEPFAMLPQVQNPLAPNGFQVPPPETFHGMKLTRGKKDLVTQ